MLVLYPNRKISNVMAIRKHEILNRYQNRTTLIIQTCIQELDIRTIHWQIQTLRHLGIQTFGRDIETVTNFHELNPTRTTCTWFADI
jgi:hypothetical protein